MYLSGVALFSIVFLDEEDVSFPFSLSFLSYSLYVYLHVYTCNVGHKAWIQATHKLHCTKCEPTFCASIHGFLAHSYMCRLVAFF